MIGSDLQDRKIAVVGTGREGQAARRWLRRRWPGIALAFLDEGTPEDAFVASLTCDDVLVIGPLEDARLEGYDLLIRSPGISPYRPAIERARAAGVQVTTPSTLWFESHADARTICVTGTKGKSTTSALLAHLLGACGKRVQLAGNIGRPLLDCDDAGVDWWVIELSSYQLADLEAEPDIGVLLNLSAEHLDWHGSVARYHRDKLRLAELVRDGSLVANADDPVIRGALSNRPNVTWFNHPEAIHARGGGLFDGDRVLRSGSPAGLPGSHNLANAAAALTALRLVGETLPAAVDALDSFQPLPHRLQLLGETNGVRYINDSISSAPVAAAAALSALAGERVVLIIGGFDRGVDWSPYWETVRQNLPEAIIGLPDNGPLLLEAAQAAGIRPARDLHRVDDLEQAVVLARRLAPRGGVVLLSPGAPSFPQFQDYRERGRRFAELSGLDRKASFDGGWEAGNDTVRR
jgi:UDP-N-acetylmuramoylalanine--D-glutamate ligase